MSKQIEAGCRAVIVNSNAGNNGLIVNVICRVLDGMDGVDVLKTQGDRWMVDSLIKSTRGEVYNHIGEKLLKRIDEYDGNKKIEWEDIKDIWNPERVLSSNCIG